MFFDVWNFAACDCNLVAFGSAIEENKMRTKFTDKPAPTEKPKSKLFIERMKRNKNDEVALWIMIFGACVFILVWIITFISNWI